METGANKAADVCQKLLDVLDKEKQEIAASNLDRIEHYCSIKMELITELDEINKTATRNAGADKSAQIEPLLKKIIDLNEANAEAVRSLKKNVLSEISTGHKKNKALKAYNP